MCAHVCVTKDAYYIKSLLALHAHCASSCMPQYLGGSELARGGRDEGRDLLQQAFSVPERDDVIETDHLCVCVCVCVYVCVCVCLCVFV
jgi:hypothetical protein